MTVYRLPWVAPAVPDSVFTTPSSARLTDFCLGGGEHYSIDRTLAAELSAAAPSWRLSILSDRLHTLMTCELLARHGFRQFLDLGCGYPPTRRPRSRSAEPFYKAVRRLQPEAVVVAVDSDPVVGAHARAVPFGGPGTPAFVAADLRKVSSLQPALSLLDCYEPIAVLLHDVLAWIPDDKTVRNLMHALRHCLPLDSAISLTHATPDLHGLTTHALAAKYQAAQLPWRPRTGDAITELLGIWRFWGIPARCRPTSGTRPIPCGSRRLGTPAPMPSSPPPPVPPSASCPVKDAMTSTSIDPPVRLPVLSVNVMQMRIPRGLELATQRKPMRSAPALNNQVPAPVRPLTDTTRQGPLALTRADRAQHIARLTARMRQDVTTGTWPAGVSYTRADLASRYHAPLPFVTAALHTLREDEVIEGRPDMGVRMRQPEQLAASQDWSRVGTRTADIQHIIRSRIADGTYPPGFPLPRQSMLAQSFGVCATTVSQALRPLRRENLITVVDGKGTYVTDQAQPRPGPSAAAAARAQERP
ncbi:SAM-dependent methyltransferase [Streptomyces sp. NPDC059991]|uniref:SAM-dependent methyltransferase n=1 Tax=Streptomyces sp. NPDC059991 TaxID=3347028 RepID=UPI0036843606